MIGDSVIYAAPAEEPVTLAEIQTFCRESSADFDDLFTSLGTAARQHLEALCGRAFVTQTWDYYRDTFPYDCDRFQLPHSPIATVTGVYYTDTSGVETTFSSSNYFVVSQKEPGEIVLNYATPWPTIILRPSAGVRVRYVAGRATDSIWPGWEDIRTAIKQLVNHWYQNPDYFTEGRLLVVPDHIHSIVSNWRVRY